MALLFKPISTNTGVIQPILSKKSFAYIFSELGIKILWYTVSNTIHVSSQRHIAQTYWPLFCHLIAPGLDKDQISTNPGLKTVLNRPRSQNGI